VTVSGEPGGVPAGAGSQVAAHLDAARADILAFTRPSRVTVALLHSVYDQPDADSVRAQFDRIRDSRSVKLRLSVVPMSGSCRKS